MRWIWTFLIMAAMLAGAAAPVFGQDGGRTYIVQAGDNLYRISLRYDTTIDALMQANNITNPSKIYTGQRLVVPGNTAESGGGKTFGADYFRSQTIPAAVQPQTPVVQQPVSASPLVSVPPSASAPPSVSAPPLVSAQPTAGVHVVAPGENLFRIAKRYGVSMSALANVNHIINPSKIYAGQRLQIPSGNMISYTQPLVIPQVSAQPVVPQTPVVQPPAAEEVVASPSVSAELTQVLYSGDKRVVHINVRVTNHNVTPALAGGRYYIEPLPDGGKQWVTLLSANHDVAPVPVADPGNAPLWKFVVYTNDGLTFPVYAGCKYLETLEAHGKEPTAEGGFEWSVVAPGGWFDCGNAWQVKPDDLAPGQSAEVPLLVYLNHPRESEGVWGRRITRLDFYAFDSNGSPLGLLKTFNLE